jgi:hypothetical protein
MMKIVIPAATALLFATPASAATCLLEVNGKAYIDGPCEFSSWEGGDFQILAGDYFAYVYPSHDPANGYWNGTPEATHAHDALGELRRDGACWVNETAKVCAYGD